MVERPSRVWWCAETGIVETTRQCFEAGSTERAVRGKHWIHRVGADAAMRELRPGEVIHIGDNEYGPHTVVNDSLGACGWLTVVPEGAERRVQRPDVATDGRAYTLEPFDASDFEIPSGGRGEWSIGQVYDDPPGV